MKILWIPHAGWHIPQRAHLFCRPLSERHEVHVTDWVADFYNFNDYLSLRYLRNFSYRRYKDGRITVHGIPRFSPALYSRFLRRINTNIYSRYVRRIINQYKIDVVVGTFVVPPPKAPRLIFDLFDDNVAYWRSFGRVTTYADEIEKSELEYLNTADAIVAASSVLVDKVKSLGVPGPVYLIPNGVDLHRFDHADGSSIRQRLGVKGKLIGSVGNHDKPAELDKIISVAKVISGKDITFLVAGRGTAMKHAQKRAQCEGLTNVIFQGFIPQEQVADVISALDVGLCPYAKTPGADASCPMRLLTYSAGGIPVVCTNLEEVQRLRFPNVILVNDDNNSLAEGIQKALKLNRGRPPQITNYDIHYLVDKLQKIL